MTWWLMAAVVFGWPLYSAWSWPLKKDELVAGDPDVRRRITVGTIVRQWGILGVVLASWWWEGGTLASLRIASFPSGLEWLGVAASAAMGGWVATTSLQAAGSAEARAAARGAVDEALLALMPRTPVERARFAALSVTAGVCEELLYRGVLWALLLPHLGVVATLALTSLAFGGAHLYQGPRGVVKTGLVGAALAGFALASGTLWVAVVLHALVDVVQGHLLAAAATVPEA